MNKSVNMLEGTVQLYC